MRTCRILPLPLSLGRGEGKGVGFFPLLRLRRFVLRGNWGLGPSDEEDDVLIEEEGWFRGERRTVVFWSEGQ